MSSSGPKELKSVVLAQKGQALPSSNGPRAGERTLTFSKGEQDLTALKSHESTLTLQPTAALTSEVVVRGKKRSNQSEIWTEKQIESAGPDEIKRPEKHDDISLDSANVEDAPAEERSNKFIKNTALFIAVLCLAVFMTWVALFA